MAAPTRAHATELSNLRKSSDRTIDIQYTIYATELSILSGTMPYKSVEEIRATALKVFARSGYKPATELLESRPDFVRTTTESEKQVENILASNEYRESVAPPVEREVVTITTVVTITRENEEISITSETTTKSNVAAAASRDRLMEMIAASAPVAQGLIREKMDVDTGLLTGNNEKPYKREYNSRVTLAAYIDGYKGGVLIERKQRMNGFKIGSKYGVPKYDLVQMGVIMFVTESPSITLYESYGGEERFQVFSSIDISDDVRKAIDLLDRYPSNWELFTPDIVELTLQSMRKK